MSHVSTLAPPLSRDGIHPSSRKPRDATNRFAHYLARPILHSGPLIFSGVISGVLVLAWLNRDEGHLTAESGLGYWLGIAGGVMMLLLVAYPMRKRFTSLSRIGRVASWFRFHMILGVLGPALVVLHTNFKLGSLNSRLALFTMLTVVASGIAGRYLYAKVHRGLYGQQAELRDVLADITSLKLGLGNAFANDAELAAELAAFAPPPARTGTIAGGLASCLTHGVRSRRARRRIMARIQIHVKADKRIAWRQRRQASKTIAKHLRLYFAAVRKAERLALFERIFGLWHHLHMPLFILLALTVTLHIIAVHRF